MNPEEMVAAIKDMLDNRIDEFARQEAGKLLDLGNDVLLLAKVLKSRGLLTHDREARALLNLCEANARTITQRSRP